MSFRTSYIRVYGFRNGNTDVNLTSASLALLRMRPNENRRLHMITGSLAVKDSEGNEHKRKNRDLKTIR